MASESGVGTRRGHESRTSGCLSISRTPRHSRVRVIGLESSGYLVCHMTALFNFLEGF